jgi:flagellar basal body-associated protein FliL
MSSPTSENSKKKIIINVIIFIVVAAALAVVIYFIIQVTKLKGANPETQKPTISMEKTIITKLPTI